jgi:predicted HTH domain antitoxin
MLIEIPDAIIRQANVTEDTVRLQIAITLFQEEIFTLGQASEFLGVPQLIFQKELAKRKISVHYDVEDFREDLKTLRSIA